MTATRRHLPASVLLALGIVASAGACGSSRETTASASDAGAADASEADAIAPLLPYPPGPYGGAVGDVLPDFFVMGYAMSETERDSTKLPFRAIKLSEVRSKTGCECLVIGLTAAGVSCGPCADEDRALSTLIANDPTICALEIIWQNYDTTLLAGAFRPNAPTRADLDQFTQFGQEPFPVGIDTASSSLGLSTGTNLEIPQNYFVRTEDMKLVGLSTGSPLSLGAKAHAACTSQKRVETLATGLDPKAVVVSGAVFVADAVKGLLKMPAQPGSTPVAVDPRLGDALAADATNVYYGASSGGMSSIVSVPAAGGASKDLLTATSAFIALASDATSVYFARADGVVGSVPVGGGNPTVLASGESLAPSIAVDGSNVYFVAKSANEIAAVPKTGGPRAVALAADAYPPDAAGNHFRPTAVRVAGGDGLVAAEEATDSSGALVRFTYPPSTIVEAQGWPRPAAIATSPSGLLFIAFRVQGPVPAGMIAWERAPKETIAPLTTGEPGVSALAQGDSYVYFTTAVSAPGANDGALKRITFP